MSAADQFTNTVDAAEAYDRQHHAYPDYDLPDVDDVDWSDEDTAFYAREAQDETERLADEARYGPDRAGAW